ncbi:hypothetical protein ACJW30_10G038600 [Castanea mollissima]
MIFILKKKIKGNDKETDSELHHRTPSEFYHRTPMTVWLFLQNTSDPYTFLSLFQTQSVRNDGISSGDVEAGHESELRYSSEVDVNVMGERGACSRGSDSRRYEGFLG